MSDNDYNYDEDYSELTIVRRMHELPHLDSSLNSQSKEFDITYEEQWNGYTRSLLTLPIICGSMGVFLVLLLQLYLCGSCCLGSNNNTKDIFYSSSIERFWFRHFAVKETQNSIETSDCETHSSNNDTTIDPQAPTRKYLFAWQRLMAIVVIISIVAGAVGVAQMVLSGNAELGHGVGKLQGSLSFVEDTFDTLVSSGSSLVSDGDDLLNHLDNAASTGCPAADNFNEDIEIYIAQVEKFLRDVKPIPDHVSYYHDRVDTWLVDYKNYTIWALYATLMVTIGLLLFGGVFKLTCFTSLGYTMGQPLLLIYFACVTVEMAVLIGWADFCMSPVNNLMGAIPRGHYDITTYFVTCTGDNPFEDELDEASYYLGLAEAGLTVLSFTLCFFNSAVRRSLDKIDDIQDSLDDIEDIAQCKTTRAEVDSLLYEGFCQKSFRGVYQIWLGQYLSAAFVLALILAVSLAYCPCCNAPQRLVAPEHPKEKEEDRMICCFDGRKSRSSRIGVGESLSRGCRNTEDGDIELVPST